MKILGISIIIFLCETFMVFLCYMGTLGYCNTTPKTYFKEFFKAFLFTNICILASGLLGLLLLLGFKLVFNL